MTHLPECVGRSGFDLDCICDLLRLCEQRVRAEAARDVRALMYPPGEPIRIDYVQRTVDVERIIAIAGGSA